jgi:hypothetical protein
VANKVKGFLVVSVGRKDREISKIFSKIKIALSKSSEPKLVILTVFY